MANRTASKPNELKHKLCTRVDAAKYAELIALLDANPQNDMSSLLRDILHSRPIKVVTRDRTLDNFMEELVRLRAELKAIGVNINQITRHFNTYPEPRRKAYFATMAFKEYQTIDSKVDTILDLISKIGAKWLSA